MSDLSFIKHLFIIFHENKLLPVWSGSASWLAMKLLELIKMYGFVNYSLDLCVSVGFYHVIHLTIMFSKIS